MLHISCSSQQATATMNMRVICLYVYLSLFLGMTFAAPSDFVDEPSEIGVRLPRATCDLLSVTIMGNNLGDSACAGHCLALRRGFRGGHCRDGVCHCRK